MKNIILFLLTFFLTFFSGAEYNSNSTTNGSELYTKILDLETRLREIEGRIQHTEYTYKQLIAKITNLTDDMNYRFSKMDQKKSSEADTVKDLKSYVKIFEQGDFSGAREGINNYIKYSNGTDKGEAYYWLGRCYMEEKNYNEAGTYFLKSYKYYPASTKAADSLLHLSFSLEKLDKKNRACTILGRLDAEYPNRSEEDKLLSKQQKTKLKCATK